MIAFAFMLGGVGLGCLIGFSAGVASCMPRGWKRGDREQRLGLTKNVGKPPVSGEWKAPRGQLRASVRRRR